MKTFQMKSLLSVLLFGMLSTSAFAVTGKPTFKEIKEQCVASLQPPLAKGEKMTPAQHEKFRECVASKRAEQAKASKPVAQNTGTKK